MAGDNPEATLAVPHPVNHAEGAIGQDRARCPDDSRASPTSSAIRSDVLPWDHNELRLYRTIVPQMVLWLPDDEAAQWRFAFEAELERLAA